MITMHRNLLTRAYGLLGAATTVIFMMAMFGVSNTLYSLLLSTMERAVGSHPATATLASNLSNASRLLTRRS